jgi:hypothetical protein
VVDLVSGYNIPSNPKSRPTYLKAFKKKFEEHEELMKTNEEVKALCKKFLVHTR